MIRKLTHQEILESKKSVEEVKKMPRTPLVLVADNLRSLYNIGSLFRTCDALLIEKIFLCGICGTPPRSQIEKVALGATEVVPWEYRKTTEEAIEELKKTGYEIVALELAKDRVDYSQKRWRAKTAVVVGNEVDGIGESVAEICDSAVEIPMLGRANSLNVATALAVVAYDFLKRYE